jgi:mono/diheme cytochrome c family protein
MQTSTFVAVLGILLALPVDTAMGAEPARFDREIAPLFKRHCVKCHGPAKQEGKLNLSTAGGLLRGGTEGGAIVPHDAEGSLIWQRVNSEEMPPGAPLSPDEKQVLKQWILAGTAGLRQTQADASDHWAFRVLSPHPAHPAGNNPLIPKSIFPAATSPVDQFLLQELATDGLEYLPEADRSVQIRRVSFDLIGLPPTPAQRDEFVSDLRPDAYERMLDRFLASPHFGERLGKVWLDAAGYADSNGYFNADSDRPLAYRYRDYVIRALNTDKPFDQFLREQIAGDELAHVTARSGETVTAASGAGQPTAMASTIELLEATHYVRNGQDGSGESDGNPDEVRVDRYTVLETAMQNLSTGLLGLTIQCAKCHDHKFEPLTQQDYYRFQAILLPAFPPEQWMKPNDRIVYASHPHEFETWQARLAEAETNVARLKSEITTWVRDHRPRGKIVFSDPFDGATDLLVERWSGQASEGDQLAGTVAVRLDVRDPPAAIMVDGRLQLREGGPAGDKSLSTRQVFDWTPDIQGGAIQVTFDLVDNRIDHSVPAERIGYLLALNDFRSNRAMRGGNLLIDGHPSAGTAVHSNYPGTDAKHAGTLGKTGYVPGRNYGVRVTNIGGGQFQLQQLVDGITEEPSIKLAETDLPDGAFGFEYCCGRSFIVDQVVVESFVPSEELDPLAEFVKELNQRRQPLEAASKGLVSLSNSRPGKIAWTTDVIDEIPQVHVFERGNYNSPGAPVDPAGFAVLESGSKLPPLANDRTNDTAVGRGSGRRLAFAKWLTEPDSKRAGLVARVQVNRLWQHLFGTGIVATADNFGLSGAVPSHPELLDWLATESLRSDWSTKSSLRQIIGSSAYRQSSLTQETSPADPRWRSDADCRRLSRFPIRRLDAEAIRDGLLASSGDLDDQLYGPYIPTTRTGQGETIVPEDHPGVRRRSLYLQQRRTQVHSLLQVFDAPSIVFNSTRRPRSTMPLQSLSLLNSEFVVARSIHLAQRLEQWNASDTARQIELFRRTTGHPPTDTDLELVNQFLEKQRQEYGETSEGRTRAWSELCQILLIGNSALYLE